MACQPRTAPEEHRHALQVPMAAGRTTESRAVEKNPVGFDLAGRHSLVLRIW